MIGASELPPIFYLDPTIDTARLPMGAEFVCVFAPESTVGDGWVIMTFRVTRFYIAHNKTWTRGVQPISKQPITEVEALELYTEVYERVPT